MIPNYAPGGNRDSEVSPPVTSLQYRCEAHATATPLVDAGLSPHAAVLWIGVHKDDEALVAGALLRELPVR